MSDADGNRGEAVEREATVARVEFSLENGALATALVRAKHAAEPARRGEFIPRLHGARLPLEKRVDALGARAQISLRESEADCADRLSVALGNLRGAFILILIGFHSSLAYLGFVTASSVGFNQPPFGWRAFPIVDSQRFFGFDILCAWQDVYLMALMFFVSGLFAWPSLSRKGSGRFLADRLLRLGAPFVFGVVVVVPIALYPAYRVTAIDPTLVDYLRSYLALPFLPNGPLWFLWLLFVVTLAPPALQRFAPGAIVLLGRLSAFAAARPSRYFIGLTIAAALAYVPLALAFTPWDWTNHGPLSFQLSRPLVYVVYYLGGLGVGVYGRERGLLALDGALARRWRAWGLLALISLLLWMGLTGWSLSQSPSPPLALQIAADLSYALAGTSSFYFAMALCLRFGAVRRKWLDALSNNAMGIYVIHYAPLVWLQFALLDVHIGAIAKAAIVFGGVLLVSLAATKALRVIPFGPRLIGQV